MKITGFTGSNRMPWYGIRSSIGALEWLRTIAWRQEQLRPTQPTHRGYTKLGYSNPHGPIRCRPIRSCSVRLGPVQSVRLAPARSASLRSDPFEHDAVRSGPSSFASIHTGRDRYDPGLFQTGKVRLHPIHSTGVRSTHHWNAVKDAERRAALTHSLWGMALAPTVDSATRATSIGKRTETCGSFLRF